VKNELLTYQIFLNRYLGREKKNLIARITLLSSDYINNIQEIGEVERKLRLLSEQEIESALIQHPVFEHLNGEKMSPYFLKLAKGAKKTASLLQVVDDDGNRHETNRDCKEYITKYFEKIYKAPEAMPLNFTGVIERFLGPEICNSRIVLDCKISDRESALLDRDISLLELDSAVKDGKLRTASGMDGFSNFFIKKFWSHLRIPLHNYALCCFRKGQLTENFSTASVRLIPKKGDTTRIKNW
jgi:hypothetical protein